MKNLLSLLVLTMVAGFAMAQNVVVKGKIMEENSSDIVPFANVAVKSDTSSSAKLITGAVSNEKGEFSIKTKEKNFVLQFSSIGYRDKFLPINTSKHKVKNGVIEVGEIILQKDVTGLQEVKIIAKQNHIEMHNDKLVVNIDDGVSATSASVFEMLKKVPGVVIDKDENLTLQGRSGILFQFDGRDIRIPWASMKAILKGMPPSNVKKIETITSPSSKYEAEGTAGIINIIMTENVTEGFSGSVNSWNGYDGIFKTGDGVDLSYVNNKWTISGGLNGGYFSNKNEMEMKQLFYGYSDTTLSQMENSTTKDKFTDLSGNLSIDYKIDTNSSIGGMFSYGYNAAPFVDNDPTITKFSKSPTYNVFQSYYSKNKSEWKNHNIMASAYYNHRFDTLGGQYSITFDYTHDATISDIRSRTDYFTNYLDGLTKTEQLKNYTDGGNNGYSLKFDVIKPFSETTKLEFGVKTRIDIIDNDFDRYKDSHFDTTVSNEFGYKENVNAAYVSINKQFTKRFSMRAGLRFEHTYMQIDQKTQDIKYDTNYFDLFPNLNLSYKIGQMDNISLTYSYRISRPDYNSLNPFVNKTSDYSSESGNMHLKPQYTHKLDLNYAFHYLVFLTGSYSYSNGDINQITQASPINDALGNFTGLYRTTSMPYNIGHTQQASLGLSTMLPLGKHVQWTIWANGVWQQAKADDERLKIDMDGLYFQTWQSITLDFFLKTKLSLSGFYSTGGIQMGGNFDDMLMLSANLSKEFLNKQLKVSLGLNNFPKRNFSVHTENEVSHYRMDLDMCWQRPMVTLNVNYSFGKAASNNTVKHIENNDMEDRTSGKSSTGQQTGQTKINNEK